MKIEFQLCHQTTPRATGLSVSTLTISWIPACATHRKAATTAASTGSAFTTIPSPPSSLKSRKPVKGDAHIAGSIDEGFSLVGDDYPGAKEFCLYCQIEQKARIFRGKGRPDTLTVHQAVQFFRRNAAGQFTAPVSSCFGQKINTFPCAAVFQFGSIHGDPAAFGIVCAYADAVQCPLKLKCPCKTFQCEGSTLLYLKRTIADNYQKKKESGSAAERYIPCPLYCGSFLYDRKHHKNGDGLL